MIRRCLRVFLHLPVDNLILLPLQKTTQQQICSKKVKILHRPSKAGSQANSLRALFSLKVI